MATTIGDVARVAGVSRSTVSSVLTGRKAVSPETRAKIEAAIATLDFSVNSGARALATARTMTLGLVVRFDEAEFGPSQSAYLVAITDAARAQGYSVLLLTDPDGTAAVRGAISARQVDGLVLMHVVEDDPRIEPIAASGFPAVLIGMPSERHGLDAIDLDFAAGARLLVDRMADAGHRSGLFVGWPDELLTSGATYARRFRDAALTRAAERGVALQPVAAPVNPTLVRATLREALARVDADCTALLFHNDAAVAMLPTVLQERGMTVPRDVSVLSLHSAALAQLYALEYTSVESRLEQVIEEAVTMVLRRIGGEADRPVAHLVAPSFVERDSVANLHRTAPAR
ncbi:LacI family transcriptional regulator [Actinomycetota bacterium]|nr:LacI family transcriptional regulator [Actinomycetota bacterium]